MPEQPQRQVLPIPDRPHVGVTTYDAKDPDTAFPPIEPLRPPDGAPNVLIILIDDAGFGSSSAFGGPCRHAELRAARGERAQVQPLPHDRALLADAAGAAHRPQPPRRRHGRHHRDRDLGARATARSGRRPRRRSPRRSSSTATRRRSSASATRCRSGRRARWARSTPGPPAAAASSTSTASSAARRTSTRRRIYDGTVPVEPDRTPEEGYHFTEDMTDHAIDWVRQQKALMPDKPFFVYFAPGATHAPHHVPPEWSAKYKGKFDQGWDSPREETLARQKELGVDPGGRGADRAARGDPRLGRDAGRLKPVLARQMEVYAGFMEHTDHHVGRLIDALDDLDILDDTLVYFIIGDNGASAEGTPNGCFNELDRPQRRRRARDARVHGLADRRLRDAEGLQPLRGRLGARDGHAVPVDEAGRLALGRHAQRHDRPLARTASRPRARSATSSTT